MPGERSERTELESTSDVDRLLRVLCLVSERDPSPALREHLQMLAARRLREKPGKDKDRRLALLKPAFTVALLVALGVRVSLFVNFRQHAPIATDTTPRVNQVPVSAENKPPARSVAHALISRQAQKPLVTTPSGARRITMRLPYSNSAIETGTDTTIRVAVSQSELVSMGFPISTTVQDRRVLAELTLGDDGLPRAISLPLPLEVMKEKK